MIPQMIKTQTPECLLYAHIFLSEKGDIRTFHRPYHFIWTKLLKFQETFLEKFLASGFGADSPNIQYAQKSTALPCFFICQNVLELRSKPCFKGLFVKSPLKIRKNFLTNNNSNKNTIKDKIYIDFSENI